MFHKTLKSKSNQKGFTIIEVLIVLAIAGLILLIVFLAVPGLQRSARNTQRKNDVSAIGGAVANYIDNNGGSLPATAAADSSNPTTVVDICGAACGSGNMETAKLGLYDPGSVTFGAYATPSPTLTISQVEIVNGSTCNSNGTGLGTNNTPRTSAILYAIETGNGVSQQCLEQ